MPIEYISDVSDPRLECFRNLKATNATRSRQTLIAEGDKLTHRLIDSGLPVEALLLAERFLDEFAPRVAPDTAVFVLPEAQIEQLVGFNFHRGVLACGRRPADVDFVERLALRPRCTLLVCPEIHDPENMGAILRLAAVFDADGVALGPDCCNPFARRVLRVSMGAAFRVPIAEHADLLPRLGHWQSSLGLEIWATVTDPAAVPLDQANRPDRLALVLGSEGHGLSEEWCRACDRQVTIPMRTDFDSLNVAMAAGILLYQLGR